MAHLNDQKVLTWEMADRFIWHHGWLLPAKEDISYEDERLKELCFRYRAIWDEQVKIQEEIHQKGKAKPNG